MMFSLKQFSVYEPWTDWITFGCRIFYQASLMFKTSERGFSINKELLVENLHEQSLVGLQQVHDGVTARGGIECVVVTKKLIHSDRNAHARYVEILEKQSTEARRRRRNNHGHC
ncbi:hypothetical protein PR048_021088 [Dryococelus australis]|uniref:Uncharacterized protein n=1 Tax=Dryococelus australis TaxID=614101 RepID=A0ABQ9GX86_9NEOP|nr:hypothetical protein PR048_021088 [Dryococelus australis]